MYRMKNKLLIVLLSIVVFNCNKDDTEKIQTPEFLPLTKEAFKEKLMGRWELKAIHAPWIDGTIYEAGSIFYVFNQNNTISITSNIPEVISNEIDFRLVSPEDSLEYSHCEYLDFKFKQNVWIITEDLDFMLEKVSFFENYSELQISMEDYYILSENDNTCYSSYDGRTFYFEKRNY